MTRLWLWTVTPSTVFSVLCHFVILYMVSIEIVSFCRIISLWNFQYRNHVHSITLMSFQIISQNLVQYKAWLDDVQRLRNVTSLDVSAVAGHHAMPAALLFTYYLFFFRCGHGIPWWRWNKDNQLSVKVLKICTRKGWWWWEKRKLILLLTVYILYAVYEERKYWNEFWSLLFY